MKLGKSGFLRNFYYYPFETVDNLQLKCRILGREFNLNFFQKYEQLRRSIVGLALVSLLSWAVFGFDSTPMQFLNTLVNDNPSSLLPSLLNGRVPTFESLHAIYDSGYGLEMHWSAFVIYGLMFWALSYHFDKNLGIKGSKNVAFASSLMFLSVAVFEFFWMGSYAYFQHQPWVVTFAMPQLRILLQNVVFLSVGIMGVLYMWADSFVTGSKRRTYRFNWNLVALVLVVLSVGVAMVWWNYPGYVQRISVPLSTGEVWVNTNRFPQTIYTVDVNPTDSINAGVQFYVTNDLIHAWNTLVKVIWTFTFMYVGLVKRFE